MHMQRQERSNVAAHTEEGCVAQRGEPGHPHHQIEREHQQCHRGDAGDQDQLIGQQQAGAKPGCKHDAGRAPGWHRKQRIVLHRLSNPAGRQASSTAMARKKNRLPQSEAQYLLAVSTVPITRAATSVPAMLPMPPTATTTSTSTRYLSA